MRQNENREMRSNLGLAVIADGIKVSADINGIEKSGSDWHFTPEKIEAMRSAFSRLDTDRLYKIGFTRELNADSHYLRERRSWRDIFKSKYTDGAQVFRGVLLGDLLIAVIVGEGKVISGLHGNANDKRTGVFTTSSFEDATTYTRKALTKVPGVMNQHVLGLYKEFSALVNLIGSEAMERLEAIILAPVILRMDNDKIERKRKAGLLKTQRYIGNKGNFPYLTIDDFTDEFLAHIKDILGIDLIDLRDQGMIVEDVE